jgi:diguanylate cyclase (GGDEF)-like protein/PAS domain S-box-containing protein
MPTPAVPAPAAANEARRETLVESAAAGGFLVAAVALAATGAAGADLWLAGWLGVICALLSRVEFEVGDGYTRPVQLVFVPMLLLLNPAIVPLVAAGGMLAAKLPDVVAGRLDRRHALFGLADCWFALPPAALLALTGRPAAAGLQVLVVTAAVAAQFAGDLGVTSLRLRALGIDTRELLGAMGWVYLVDALLTPVGALAASAGERHAVAVAGVLPLAALLSVFARERSGRIAAATELQRVAEESGARLQTILGNSSDLLVMLDADGTLRTLTGSVQPIFGPRWSEAEGTPLIDRVHPEDAATVRAFLAAMAAKATGESHEGEWRMRHADGSHRHTAVVATNLLDDPRVGALVLTVRDVEARKAFEEQLRHRAFHDPLTGLANRALFYDRVDHALQRHGRDDSAVAVLFLDLDDFKGINDRFGHAAGDELLKEVARRIASVVRAADTPARLGGDELGVLIEGGHGSASPGATAERLLETLRPPFHFEDGTVSVSASVGVAVSGASDHSAEELLRKADVAMYAAKRGGKRRVEVYDAALEASAAGAAEERGSWFAGRDEQREEILSVLADPDALAMVFQPIVDLRTGRIAGYESLARFNRLPRRGPDVWFAQAQRCGLGAALEARAVELALATPGRPAGRYLTVNLSPSSLVADEVRSVLPERLDDLVIEITEHELVSDDPAITTAIAALRERGARLAVDDVGAGYAGLTHVMRLKPDIIKLDRALTSGVDGDPVKAALIASFVGYARDIHAVICAEGIETLPELTRLADLDVAFGQGYRLARPGPPWPEVDGSAIDACVGAARASLAGVGEHDGGLGALVARVAAIATPADLEACLAPIAAELHADRVRVAAPSSAATTELLADDPRADPDEVGALRALGYGSRLQLPIVRDGVPIARLEVYTSALRPWTRFEIGRARMIGHHLSAVLGHVELADQRSDAPGDLVAEGTDGGDRLASGVG